MVPSYTGALLGLQLSSMLLYSGATTIDAMTYEEHAEANVSRTLVADGDGCCSWNLKTCNPNNTWCNAQASRCEDNCSGTYIDQSASPSSCTARYKSCSSSDQCCDIGACVQFSWGVACGLPSDGQEQGTCCSWDLKNCGVDDSSHYCNLSESNCESSCTGQWVDPKYRSRCTARWQPCSSTSECCEGGMECMMFSWGGTACGMPGDNGGSPTDPPTASPIKSPSASPSNAPVASPSSSPTAVPTKTPSVSPSSGPTDAPTGVPTKTPSVSPSESPTKTPTGAPISSSPTQSPDGGSAEVGTCCSWDLKVCGESDPNNWCNLEEANCEGSCNGHWIDPTTRTTCTARYKGCSASSECCSEATCVQMDGYTGCGLPGDGIGTLAPTVPLTAAPSKAPVLPTASPSASPMKTTPSPTKSSGNGSWPAGPYVTADVASAAVVIPEPPLPSGLGGTQAGCPHLESGLLDWHDAATWSGLTSPSVGADVTLPANSRVLISKSVVPELGKVTIPSGSELIIGEDSSGPDAEITLDAQGFDVKGALTAGSESCRIQKPITITLHGDRPNDVVANPREPEYKGISVNGSSATVSLHGKRFFKTWTRLAKTVEVGDSILMLQHDVNWAPGQEVILVTTALKDSREWHENEVMTIQSVVSDPVPGSGVGAAVTLTSPVQHRHVALPNAYQAEVGLLSRTIKIQGAADDSYATDPDPLNCSYNGARSFLGSDQQRPCPNTELTGYGGHVMVSDGAKGYVEGVELFRMGQTNVLGRYPIHFHLLGDCPDCYFKDSSVHKSFYRCISIHATNQMIATENVAYDVIGYCYYLEDGVERDNTISFNLGAHIHLLGPEAPWGGGQTTELYQQSNTLTLPADVTASAFYITNVQNNVIGNTASGGWAGFAFPNLPEPIGLSRNSVNMRPSAALPETLDGNTAHSTAWWWYHAGAFYFGGALYYNNNDVLEYNAGRDFNFQAHGRVTCLENMCDAGNCNGYCPVHEFAWVPLTNSKVYLSPYNGLNSWTGRMEIGGFETHDVGLSIEALAAGFWIDNLYAECRTGESLSLPPGARADRMPADGFGWYDTGQEHIVSNSEFKNCGFRSTEYNQYNTSPTRGCTSGDISTGCRDDAAVFSFLTHSDQFNPEIMQATKNIKFTDCGRRFKMKDFRNEATRATSVSSRIQNWLDADGSVTELGVPSVIASGLSDTGLWWTVDDNVVYDPQAPSQFIDLSAGPDRDLGHITVLFDDSQHNQVGGSVCSNGNVNVPCPALGYIRHLGPMFQNDPGLPVTAASDIAGMVGGFGWLMTLNGGAPKKMTITYVEVNPSTPMILSVAYPLGTTFTITGKAAFCTSGTYTCEHQFQSVSSVDDVRSSDGNKYHFDATSGILTFRIIQTPQTFVGLASEGGWFKPDYDSIGKWGNGFAINKFERDGVILPMQSYGPELVVEADCSSGGAYCNNGPPSNSASLADASVCSSGFEQTAYDACCSTSNPSQCEFADGSTSV